MYSGLFSMFDYEDDPVFQFMLYEFVTDDDSDDTDDAVEPEFTVEVTITVDANSEELLSRE